MESHRSKFVLIALIGILVIGIGAAFFTKNTRLQKGDISINPEFHSIAELKISLAA